MAEWKKVIVSGSAAELGSLTLTTGLANSSLANDGITIAGVDTSLGGSITAATIGNAIGAFSASAQVTGITNAQLANDGITIAGVDTSLGGTITAATIGEAIGAFSSSAQVTGVTNAQLQNDGITIGAQDTSLGGSVLNDLTHSATGSFTGSFTGDGSNLTGVSATSFDFDNLDNTGVTNSSVVDADLFAFSDNGTEKKITYAQLYGNIFGEVSNDATIAVDGALTLKSGIVSGSAQIDHDQTTNFNANEHFTQGSITTVGTVTTGDVSAILPAGSVSASVLSSATQGTVVLTTNGVAGSTIDLGLETTDSPTFSNLTITNDLTVQGAVTELQTTNLNVEDQFILLNSGSADNTKDSGIIFGGSDGNAQQGKALIWDSNYAASGNGRLAISTADVVWNSTSNFDFASGDGYYVAGVFEGTAVAAANAEADHNGNIRIESNEIYIYA